jgi:hypothetical protein
MNVTDISVSGMRCGAAGAVRDVARAAGGIGATPVQRALELSTDKGIVAAGLPVSRWPSKVAATG